jgi:hypothetical protein
MKIISGGQTGADRAALDWALRRGLPHGGWCPKGRRAEDGTIPAQYLLREMPVADYAARTEQNVIDSDGTAIFSLDPDLCGGTLQTAQFAEKRGRPLLKLHPATPEASKRLVEFCSRHRVKTLNVAGPRASQEPAIAEFVSQILDEAFPLLFP